MSDPAAMKVVRSERIRGHHVSSRLSGDTARVVIWSQPRAVLQPALRPSCAAGCRAACSAAPAAAARASARPPVPRVMRPAIHSGLDVLTS